MVTLTHFWETKEGKKGKNGKVKEEEKEEEWERRRRERVDRRVKRSDRPILLGTLKKGKNEAKESSSFLFNQERKKERDSSFFLLCIG